MSLRWKVALALASLAAITTLVIGAAPGFAEEGPEEEGFEADLDILCEGERLAITEVRLARERIFNSFVITERKDDLSNLLPRLNKSK